MTDMDVTEPAFKFLYMVLLMDCSKDQRSYPAYLRCHHVTTMLGFLVTLWLAQPCRPVLTFPPSLLYFFPLTLLTWDFAFSSKYCQIHMVSGSIFYGMRTKISPKKNRSFLGTREDFALEKIINIPLYYTKEGAHIYMPETLKNLWKMQ